jgi:hypothetical protein
MIDRPGRGHVEMITITNCTVQSELELSDFDLPSGRSS